MALKLTQLRDVIAAAELGSLRAASRQLGIAQPAISRSIREIEKELGATLFERHQQGIRLTAIGQAFLRRAQLVQSELLRAQEEVNQIKGELSGNVSVAMSSASTFTMMPSAIRSFRKAYPAAILKVTECFFHEAELKLVSGQIDFFVGPFSENAGHSQFIREKLYDQARVVIARKGHPLAGAESLRDLVHAEWVKQTISDRASEVDFDNSFRKRGLPNPRIVMHTTSAIATLLSVANSDLLTIVPDSILGSPVSSRMFDILPLESPLSGPPICIVRRADLPLTPLAEYLSDMIRRAGTHYAQSSKEAALARIG